MADAIANENEPIAPPKKKKSLFAKKNSVTIPAGAKALDFFSRGKEVFAEQLEEERRKQERKAAKLERKRSSRSADLHEQSPVEDKRQKYTANGYSPEEGPQHAHDRASPLGRRRESSHTSPGSRKSGSSTAQLKSPHSPTSLSASYSRELNAQKLIAPKVNQGCITLSDSESDSDAGPRKTTVPVRKPPDEAFSLDSDEDRFLVAPRKVPPSEDDDLQMSDEEFPEFVQAARERERLKAQQRLEAEKAKERSQGRIGDIFDDAFDAPKIDTDPVVEILITSKMENTKPILVKRKLSQRLREAKFGWCDRQTERDGLTAEEFRKSIFLTWKHHRLHEASSCRSLGVEVGDDGRPSYDANGTDVDGRIHLLAWTESAYETYLEREAEKERRERARAEGEDEQKKPEVAKTRLILKGKGMEDFKLIVKPSTTIQKMITAFCSGREIPEGKTVSLYFDGDKLDPESVVGETELDNMDTVEVHIN